MAALSISSTRTATDYHGFAILSSFKRLTFNVLKAHSITRVQSFHGAEKKHYYSKPNTFSVPAIPKTTSLQTQLATWEAPDDGSGSGSEEEEEEEDDPEDHDSGFQSEWEEEEKDGPSTTTTTNKYEEDLVKEVEQLLDQEERTILQKHPAPYLKKISTEKWNPVHTLALSGLVTFMDKLLEDGGDINLVDKDGATALHTAVIAKKEAVISHLLRKGASPHVRDGDGATPLHYAVQVGTKRIVKLLIKYKVDVNIADNDGWTPLHIAVQSRNRDITKILLVNGADKSRRNKDGRTPLDLSLCYGKDFKTYDLTKLLKLAPMDREF